MVVDHLAAEQTTRQARHQAVTPAVADRRVVPPVVLTTG